MGRQRAGRSECRHCRFWRRIERGAVYNGKEEELILSDEGDGRVIVGECLRYPPVLDGVSLAEMRAGQMRKAKTSNDGLANYHQQAATLFPMTFELDWCGEFQRGKCQSG